MEKPYFVFEQSIYDCGLLSHYQLQSILLLAAS